MLNFIKPTKLKLGYFLLIWIAAWSAVKTHDTLRPIVFKYLFPDAIDTFLVDTNSVNDEYNNVLTEYRKKLVEYRMEQIKAGEKLHSSVYSNPDMIKSMACHLLIFYLPQIIPSYLCSCLIVFLVEKHKKKEIATP